jgi:putative membrane protein
MFINWGYTNYGFLGLIITILVWIIIIGVIIEILRAIFGSSNTHHHHVAPTPPTPPVVQPPQKSPLDILNERYAKGEINKEEFDQKHADITHTN